MARSETVTINDRKFTATCLTVGQVRDILVQVEEKDYRPGLIDRLFEDGLPEPAFYLSLGITEEDIGDLVPEQVKELMEAVAASNPTYADMEKRMSARLAGMGKLEETLAGLQQSLKETAST